MFNKGERLGIPIYTIDPYGLYPEATTRTELLKTASVATGGTRYVNRAFIVDAAHELMTSTQHFYVLGFAPDPFKPDGKFRDIRLLVAGRPELRVRTREGYIAKAPSPQRADPADGLRADLAAGKPLDQLALRAFVVPVAPAPSGRTSVLLTTSVEYPPGDTRDDVLTLLVLAFDPDARVLASRQRKVRVPASALRSEARTITINERFDLPQGPVVLRIGATSAVARVSGTLSLSADVPRYQDRSPALSPLVLGLESPQGPLSADAVLLRDIRRHGDQDNPRDDHGSPCGADRHRLFGLDSAGRSPSGHVRDIPGGSDGQWQGHYSGGSNRYRGTAVRGVQPGTEGLTGEGDA